MDVFNRLSLCRNIIQSMSHFTEKRRL